MDPALRAGFLRDVDEIAAELDGRRDRRVAAAARRTRLAIDRVLAEARRQAHNPSDMGGLFSTGDEQGANDPGAWAEVEYGELEALSAALDASVAHLESLLKQGKRAEFRAVVDGVRAEHERFVAKVEEFEKRIGEQQ